MSGSGADRQLALVTGASGALGGAIAELLAGRGWTVIGTHHYSEPASEMLTWVRFDAATGDGAEELTAAVEASPMPLGGIFCCIGQASSKMAISDTAVDEFTEVYAANALSFVRAWLAVKRRARADRASVLALSSDAARSARSGNGPYSAAKAALDALVVTLAREEQGGGVRVNALAPCLVESPLGREVLSRKGVVDYEGYYEGLAWGRPLTTAEVAQVAVDLAIAPHWRYATGQVFNLNAVQRSWPIGATPGS